MKTNYSAEQVENAAKSLGFQNSELMVESFRQKVIADGLYEKLRSVRKLSDRCCFCGSAVDLDLEGVTYGNGKCAHEACNDGHEFNKANAADFRD